METIPIIGPVFKFLGWGICWVVSQPAQILEKGAETVKAVLTSIGLCGA